MFKKIKYFTILLMLCISLIGCNKSFVETLKTPLTISKKPSINYYTNNLITTIKKSKDLHISILYTKTGKNKVVPKDYMDRFYEFINSLKPSYFVEHTDLHIKDPEYKLTIQANGQNKFIINIFNNQFITITPWDGNYKPDIVNMDGIGTNLNLYNFVNHIVQNNIT